MIFFNYRRQFLQVPVAISLFGKQLSANAYTIVCMEEVRYYELNFLRSLSVFAFLSILMLMSSQRIIKILMYVNLAQ